MRTLRRFADLTEKDDEALLAAFADVEHATLNFEWIDFLADFGNNEDFLIDGDALVAWVCWCMRVCCCDASCLLHNRS